MNIDLYIYLFLHCVCVVICVVCKMCMCKTDDSVTANQIYLRVKIKKPSHVHVQAATNTTLLQSFKRPIHIFLSNEIKHNHEPSSCFGVEVESRNVTAMASMMMFSQSSGILGTLPVLIVYVDLKDKREK